MAGKACHVVGSTTQVGLTQVLDTHGRSRMIKHVTHISVRSVLPIFAALFFILGSISVISGVVTAALVPGPITSFSLSCPVSLSFSQVPPVWVLVLYPFLSAVVGAIAAAALSWVYNILAPRVGAVQVTLAD